MEPRLRLYLTSSKDMMETQNTRIRQTHVSHCITVNALQTRWTLRVINLRSSYVDNA